MTQNKTYSPNPDRYWADESPENIAAAIRERFDRYTAQLESLGRIELWRTADRCHHGRNPDGGYSNSAQVSFGGEQGEVAQFHVGDYRQLVLQQHTLATSQRPAIEVTATSNDPEAVSDTIVARQLLEYDLDEGGLENDLYATHERALVYGEAFAVQVWDFDAGELVGTRPIDPMVVDTSAGGLPGVDPGSTVSTAPDGQPFVPVEMPVHEGAVRVEVCSPIDVARDLDAQSTDEQPWYIVRRRAHRWNLAAKFPESSEKRRAILDAPAVTDDGGLWRIKSVSTGGESDYVHTWTLYHPPSDALPKGRMVRVVDEVWLEDVPYPFDHDVVHSDIPSVELDRITGYANSWDLLALSQVQDALESGMLSVADAGMLINWLAARGQKVSADQLENGMNLVEYDDDGTGKHPPGLAERPEVRESDFKHVEHIARKMEVLSGINATVRGSPEDDATSGADRAMKATLAVQANSAQQRTYAGLMRSVLNARVKLYKEFMSGERVIEIAGRDKAAHVKTFTAKTLEHVRRVRVELGPADLRTVEGRTQYADRMLEAYGPQVITPARYMALRTIGRLDDVDDAVADHKVLARQENDLFRQGRTADEVKSMVFHHHAVHLCEHAKDMNNLEISMDPSRVIEIQQRLAHMMMHVQQWQSCPPELLSATGQDPAPSTLIGPGPGGPPPPGGPPGAEPPPPPGAGPMPPPIDAGPNGPQMPQLPQNPLTGDRGVPGMAGGIQS